MNIIKDEKWETFYALPFLRRHIKASVLGWLNIYKNKTENLSLKMKIAALKLCNVMTKQQISRFRAVSSTPTIPL